MAVSKPPVVKISIPSNKYTVGRRSPISQMSEHHVVGDARHVIDKAKSDRIFSCNWTIALEGTIYELVAPENTSYCDNHFASNSRSLTIEHAGGLLPNYPYTEAMYQSSIKLHAWAFQTFGMLNCVRHRDIPEIRADSSKATACPGSLDVERIVREAKALLKGEDMPTLVTKADLESMTGAYFGSMPDPADYDNWIGKPLADMRGAFEVDQRRLAYFNAVQQAFREAGNDEAVKKLEAVDKLIHS